MKLNIDKSVQKLICARNYIQIERRLNEISKFVMESKKMEKFFLFSIAFFYCYIGFHIGLWLVRMFFG